MRDRRAWWAGLLAVAVAAATVGVAAWAQAPPARGKAAGRAARAKGRDAGGAAAKKAPNAADPLENAAGDPLDKAALNAAVHYRLRLKATDGTPLAVVYYPAFPARLGTGAPVVLMVHEKDRSSRDFEDPIADLKGKGLAEHLQSLGYAVLAVDLRGMGANARKPLSPQDWRMMIDDLQAAYQFLVDRHNRGKLNLGKLGVLALGEGANLAAAWAHMPGGAVSSEGRTSDIGALVLISPLADGEGFRLAQVMASLSPRFPILMMVGARDLVSADPVRSVRPIVERGKLNRVEIFDSSLHGYKMLRFEPRVTGLIARFLEGTIKFKPSAEWEPRYNLTPVAYGDIQLIRVARTKGAEPKPKDVEPAKKRPD